MTNIKSRKLIKVEFIKPKYKGFFFVRTYYSDGSILESSDNNLTIDSLREFDRYYRDNFNCEIINLTGKRY